MLHAAAKEGLAHAEIPSCALLFLLYPRLPTQGSHTLNQTLSTHTLTALTELHCKEQTKSVSERAGCLCCYSLASLWTG